MKKNIYDQYTMKDALLKLLYRDTPETTTMTLEVLQSLEDTAYEISRDYSYLVDSIDDKPEDIYMSRQLASLAYFMWKQFNARD